MKPAPPRLRAQGAGLAAFLLPVLSVLAAPDAAAQGAAPAFDHRVHVEDEGLDCAMCHRGAEDAERAGMPGLALCRLCHEEPDPEEDAEDPPAFLFDAEGRYAGELRSALSADVVFAHLRHVEAGVDCAACHGDVGASVAVDRSVAPRMADCVACHVALKQPQGCAACHRDPSAALYGLHCAVCHGRAGRGDGPAAPRLEPAPRDFGSGRFRLISTRNGVPTREDLVATIRRGMPGSSMPPAGGLSDAELAGLAEHVRTLATLGLAADLRAAAAADEDELSEAEARAIAAERMTPGAPIAVGEPAPAAPEVLDEGRRLYVAGCSSCHGRDGTGSGSVSRAGHLVNEDGTPSAARDFTAGIFKGGASHAELVRRIVGGLPGSPMPATSVHDPAELGALVAYVRSLVPPGAEESVRLRRGTLAVPRAAGALPSEPADPAWTAAPELRVALTPLVWRDERVEAVTVQALHDGERIAIRLAWRDASRDEAAVGERAPVDAAAIAIAAERDPPVFFAGATGRPVEVALWRAGAAGAETSRVVPRSRRLAGDAPEPPSHALARVERGSAASWTSRGARNGDVWELVLSRALGRASADGPALAPGASLSLAPAIWEGGPGGRGARKSFGVWQRLELAP